MKKSNLYFIYALLFTIIANVGDNIFIIGIAIISAVLSIIASIIFYYFEDKYK